MVNPTEESFDNTAVLRAGRLKKELAIAIERGDTATADQLRLEMRGGADWVAAHESQQPEPEGEPQ